MLHPETPTPQVCRPTPPGGLPQLPLTKSYQMGYQQALTDFAIADLLNRLSANSDVAGGRLNPQETETLAVILIQALTAQLNSNRLAADLDVLWGNALEACNLLARLHLPPAATDLPVTFPTVEPPRFLEGDRLQWIAQGEPTDWGVAIGRFYSFAHHYRRWTWCYLIWLDTDSPSAGWVRADIAWESDLELLEVETML
jgi:hypothetical protein